jgi:hypothetical protein
VFFGETACCERSSWKVISRSIKKAEHQGVLTGGEY